MDFNIHFVTFKFEKLHGVILELNKEMRQSYLNYPVQYDNLCRKIIYDSFDSFPIIREMGKIQFAIEKFRFIPSYRSLTI